MRPNLSSVRALALCVFAALPASLSAANPIDYATARLERRLPATRATGPIALDGRLDEPAWVTAPIAKDFIQNDPREGEPATFDTEVRLLYDDDALYIGVFAKDDNPSGIIVNELRKDFNTASADGFQVVIDTFHDERNGYQFAVNPRGREVGLADVQRGPRTEQQLGRHLGRRDAHRRKRLVRRDSHSVPHAEVRLRTRSRPGASTFSAGCGA